MKILAFAIIKGNVCHLDGVELNNFLQAPKTFKNASKLGWEPLCWTLYTENKDLLFNFVNNWVEIDFELTAEPTEMSLMKNSQDESTQFIKINSLNKIENEYILRKLNAFSTLSGVRTTPRARLERELSKNLINHEIKSVICLDVGQANWNLICDSVNCPKSPPKVLLSFDCGMPTGYNKGTLPSPPIDPYFHFYKDMWIILSHWDTDHWAGAAFNQPIYNKRGIKINWKNEALDCKWLVPNQGKNATGQKITPNAWRLALALHRNKKLFIWPKNLDYLRLRDGSTIVKCQSMSNSGRNNNNGLALIVHHHNVDPFIEGPLYTMCPGDADYISIYQNLIKSGLKNSHFIGLIASHHGGKINSAPPRTHMFLNTIIYSNGHKYGHPFISKPYHDRIGWTNSYDTHIRLIRVRRGITECLGTTVINDCSNISHFAGCGHCLTCNKRSSICPVR
ncbi:hypothetical protein [Aeromonas veronii]|uniref:hypothetical protein n=1 Tax=Aeromonas veronii TaxID=654 RepID=UPI001BCF4763|nr:hypothetical protein [Aeromonas veronii]MBS4724367.1 hypothetical protein [Aeromonas veronii]